MKLCEAELLLLLHYTTKETKQELRRVKVRMGMASPKAKSVENFWMVE